MMPSISMSGISNSAVPPGTTKIYIIYIYFCASLSHCTLLMSVAFLLYVHNVTPLYLYLATYSIVALGNSFNYVTEALNYHHC